MLVAPARELWKWSLGFWDGYHPSSLPGDLVAHQKEKGMVLKFRWSCMCMNLLLWKTCNAALGRRHYNDEPKWNGWYSRVNCELCIWSLAKIKGELQPILVWWYQGLKFERKWRECDWALMGCPKVTLVFARLHAWSTTVLTIAHSFLMCWVDRHVLLITMWSNVLNQILSNHTRTKIVQQPQNSHIKTKCSQISQCKWCSPPLHLCGPMH